MITQIYECESTNILNMQIQNCMYLAEKCIWMNGRQKIQKKSTDTALTLINLTFNQSMVFYPWKDVPPWQALSKIKSVFTEIFKRVWLFWHMYKSK